MSVADEEARLVEVSAGWDRSLGTSGGTLAGSTLLDRVHPEDRELCERWLGEVIGGDAALPTQLRVRRWDDSFALMEFVGLGTSRHRMAFAAARELRLRDEARKQPISAHPCGLEVDPGSRRATTYGAELQLTAWSSIYWRC